jgi:hypothetical protein
MQQRYILLSLCACILASSFAFSQTVQYPEFTVPLYRYAQDQRYSEHKSILYLADIDTQLGVSLFPNKNKQREFNIDSFRISISRELSKAGIQGKWVDTPDLSMVVIINSFAAAPINTSAFGVITYSLSGKVKIAVMNRRNEMYTLKDADISEMVQYDPAKGIKNEFTNELANATAVGNFNLLYGAIKKMVLRAEDSYMNAYKVRTISLSNVYRAEKKYPELVFFDSLNTKLVEDLNKKATTDYKQLVVPYETSITAFLNKEFPKGYDMKDIKVAGNYTLAFLYYLAYDTVKLRQTLDFLYENSTKFMGNRLQYNDRKPFQTELTAYYSSLDQPKMKPDSSSGDIKSIFGGAEKSSDGWLVLEKGDTLKGKHIIQKLGGTMIDLDGGNKVIFEYTNEKGKTVRKNFKYGEIRTLCFNQRVYESHKFKPNMAQAGALSMDLLRARDYMLEVVYNSEKIKVFKDSYGDDPTNSVLFARPGEKDLANQGKDWQKKKAEMLKEYFKDCPTVMEVVDKTGYDFSTEKGYIKMAQDYSTACK